MDTKEEIKNKLNIVDVIGEYVQLKQAGTNFKGLCPFHNEKTPSFMVSQEKQIYHCFGCGQGGDVISFIENIEKVDFKEALKILAPQAGVKLEEFKFDKNYSQKNRLLEINRLAANFYHQVLLQTDQAKKAREYLQNRGLNQLTIDLWQIGYAPLSWDTIIKAIKSKGFTQEEVVLAGLAVRNEKGRVYDRFRDRITFPIRDLNGQVVGFTTRLLGPETEKSGGKYINTPQTLIFNKSQVLYGLDLAKKQLREKNFLILVEGNMDVLTSYQSGVENVVATSGTSLTEDHVKTIKRFTDNLYLSFDQDQAGLNAAMRAIDLSLKNELNLKIIKLPKGVKDPDELIKQDEKAWFLAIEQAVPVMEFFLEQAISKFDLSTGQGKKKAVEFFLANLTKLQDPIEIDHWLGVAAQKFDVPETLLKESINPHNLQKNKENFEILLNSKSRAESLSELLYALAINYPQYLGLIEQNLRLEFIPTEILRLLVKKLFLYYNEAHDFDYHQFVKKIEEEQELKELHNSLALLADKEFVGFSLEQIKEEIFKIIAFLKENHHQREIKKLQRQLALAEKDGEKPEIERIMAEIAKHNQLLGR